MAKHGGPFAQNMAKHGRTFAHVWLNMAGRSLTVWLTMFTQSMAEPPGRCSPKTAEPLGRCSPKVGLNHRDVIRSRDVGQEICPVRLNLPGVRLSSGPSPEDLSAPAQ